MTHILTDEELKTIAEEKEEELLIKHEINEGLLISDLSELEFDEEYSIKIRSKHKTTDYSYYNGIYKLNSITNKLYEFTNLDHNSQIKQITVKRYQGYEDTWLFIIKGIYTYCKIYKPTTETEYVLK